MLGEILSFLLVSMFCITIDGTPFGRNATITFDDHDFAGNSTIIKLMAKRDKTSKTHYCGYRGSRSYAYSVQKEVRDNPFRTAGFDDRIFVNFEIRHRGDLVVRSLRGINGPDDNNQAYACSRNPGRIGTIHGCPSCNLVCVFYDPYNKGGSPNEDYYFAFDLYLVFLECRNLNGVYECFASKSNEEFCYLDRYYICD